MPPSCLAVHGCPPTRRGSGRARGGGCHLGKRAGVLLRSLALLSGSITLGWDGWRWRWALACPKGAASPLVCPWLRALVTLPLQISFSPKQGCRMSHPLRPAEAWEPFGEVLPLEIGPQSGLVSFCQRMQGSSSVGWSPCPVIPAREPPALGDPPAIASVI